MQIDIETRQGEFLNCQLRAGIMDRPFGAY